jgi:hypothetical protein
MGNPPRHEDRGGCPRQIGGVVVERRTVHEIAGVVDDHDDHHDAAQQID